MNLEEIKARLEAFRRGGHFWGITFNATRRDDGSIDRRSKAAHHFVLNAPDDLAALVRAVEAADALAAAAAEELDEDLASNASAARLRVATAAYLETRK